MAARSTGAVIEAPDPVAAEVRLIEVKSTAAGPYKHFLPADRKAMLEFAERAGASAWLAWWPPRKPLKWIPSDDWP